MKEHENAQGKNAMRLRALVPLCAALTLAVAGCSSNNDVATNDASASASAQTSQSAQASGSATPSESAKPSESATAQESDNASEQASDDASATSEESSAPAQNNEDAPAENYEGADKIASAPTVALDNADVNKTKDLYNSYENNLSSVTLDKAANDPSQEEAAQNESEENQGTSTGFGQLSEKTENKINEVATGNAADEFKSSALEYGINGWSQEGTSTAVGEPKLTDTEFNGQPAKLLEVCLDSSNVKVKDQAGNILNDTGDSRRSLNIFTLVNVDGQWKIANHDFPNNPDC